MFLNEVAGSLGKCQTVARFFCTEAAGDRGERVRWRCVEGGSGRWEAGGLVEWEQAGRLAERLFLGRALDLGGTLDTFGKALFRSRLRSPLLLAL